MTNEIDAKKIEEAVRFALNPLKVYDVTTDEYRAVTQEDVDRWQRTMNAAAQIERAARLFREDMDKIWGQNAPVTKAERVKV